MLLSNIFSNRLDDLVDNSDNKNVISHRQNKHATIPRLSAIRRNRGTSHSKIETEAVEKNKVARHSEMKEEAIGKNRVTIHSEMEERDIGKNRIVDQSRIE